MLGMYNVLIFLFNYIVKTYDSQKLLLEDDLATEHATEAFADIFFKALTEKGITNINKQEINYGRNEQTNNY
jgi:hypothetical protein